MTDSDLRKQRPNAIGEQRLADEGVIMSTDSARERAAIVIVSRESLAASTVEAR